MNDSKKSFFATTIGLAAVALTTLLALPPSSITAGPKYSDWGLAQPLAEVNSTANDAGPTLSRDGLSLYFQSTRTGGLGMADIWVARRHSDEEPWEPATNVTVVNSVEEDATPQLSRDGHWLYFMSRRSGSLGGGFDIWVSYREHVHDDLAWQPPTNAGALVGINTNAFEQNPFFLDNDEIGIPQLFFTRGVPSDLYVSSPLPDGTFGPPTPVAGLNSSANERGISVRFDGLEAVLMSTRAGGSGAQDLWSSTRNSVFDPWSAPVNLGALINSSGGDFDPFLAADRESLYFMSNRNAAVSGQDIFVATRVKQKPH